MTGYGGSPAERHIGFLVKLGVEDMEVTWAGEPPDLHAGRLLNGRDGLLMYADNLPANTRDIQPMLGQCWAAVADGGPTLTQHWFNVSWDPPHYPPSTITPRKTKIQWLLSCKVTSYCTLALRTTILIFAPHTSQQWWWILLAFNLATTASALSPTIPWSNSIRHCCGPCQIGEMRRCQNRCSSTSVDKSSEVMLSTDPHSAQHGWPHHSSHKYWSESP